MRTRWLFGALGTVLSASAAVLAHCDTLDGPVVASAKTALDRRDVTPVLRWVQPADEPEIRQAFSKTLSVREKGTDARELADQYFFETLVRVHRAGEGQPFTGLKPAGTEIAPGIREADLAMEKGSPDELVRSLQQTVADGVKQRFAAAHAAAEYADTSVDAGRKAASAYVQFMHYVEGLYTAAKTTGEGHGNGGEASVTHGQTHEQEH